MLLEPKMLENIIVGLLVDNSFNWYVSPKDLWFLDRKKQEEAYMLKFKEIGLGNIGGNIHTDDERTGIEILDEHSIIEFTPKINKYSVSREELREALKLNLLTKSKEDTIYTFLPSLYINFDKRELYSLYSEPASYEDFVPENWMGVYENFLSMIDRKEKYWYDENGVDLLNIENDGGIR
ncbi:hypothetical protein R6U77_00050 [Lysinibacillus louembei]|uniref:Uncharacterized protein n=1 Tax=Lysinibacillus louembei TaxID=1470088 RepID=A0ABZ0RV53_9BACI|nr:hypothetical protein [Lysinibacillus louembei]WPK12114.1 hypothetical protein R6U77_00050 [Lysinibacillus louembei]